MAEQAEVIELDPIRDILGVQSPAESIDWLNLLIYGDPGVGKTKLCGTAQDHPDTSPILFLDVEGGSVTLRKRKDIDVIQIRSMQQVQEVQNKLFKQPKMYYKTVIIDSLTELQKLDMRTVMKEQWNKKPDSTDIYVPSPREWGKSGERVRMVVRDYRDLPCNVICTALLATDQSESGKITSYHASLPGKLKSEIPGFFDIVCWMRAVEGSDGIVRTLQTTKTEKVVAKDRTDTLPGLIESPSIPLIWEIIHNQE